MAICEITLEGTYQPTATGDLANVQVVIHFTKQVCDPPRVCGTVLFVMQALLSGWL